MKVTEKMLPFPDEVVMPAFRVNGNWPQINGPEQVTMAARAAKLVEQEKLTWDDFFTMGGLSVSQITHTARMLDGYHDRYNIGAHIKPRVIEEKIIPKNRLTDLAAGWRLGVKQGEKAFMHSTIHFDRGQRSEDYTTLSTRRTRALSMMWQIAANVLHHPDMEAASGVYRDKLSQIYQDPFASRRDRDALTIPTNREVREVIEGAILDTRQSIGDTTGYKPRQIAIESWADQVFYY